MNKSRKGAVSAEEKGARATHPRLRELVDSNFVNLKQLQAFRAVMVTGTTLEAGALLRISQSAVSRLIAGLEYAAGYQLFERKGGRLRPTRQADTLLSEVERTFAHLDRVASLLRSDQVPNAECLRIVATAPMAYGLLPHALVAFRESFPNVAISAQGVVRRELRAHLDAQQFDVALSTYPLDYPEDATESLAVAQAVCVLPIGHRLAKKATVHPRDLSHDHFISMPLETGARQKVDLVFQRSGVSRRMTSEAQNGIMICQMVAAGLGISVVDEFSAFACQSNVVLIPFRPIIHYNFRFFYPVQRPRSPLSAAFTRIVKQVAGRIIERRQETEAPLEIGGGAS